jgi:hypothetical protein
MNKTDFISRIQAIGTCEDDAQRRTLLSDLQSECESDYDRLDNLVTENTQLKTDKEDLQKANMKLFLKTTEPKTPDEKPKNGEGDNDTSLTYENLFNEKGDLK